MIPPGRVGEPHERGGKGLEVEYKALVLFSFLQCCVVPL